MRRGRHQPPPFAEPLERQRQVPVLQVAEAAVNKLDEWLDVWLAKSPASTSATLVPAQRAVTGDAGAESHPRPGDVKQLRREPAEKAGHRVGDRRVNHSLRAMCSSSSCHHATRTGASVVDIGPLLRLRERNHVAQRIGPAQQHRQAIDTSSDPAVRRRSVLERLQQEPELRVGFLVRGAQRAEHARLHVELTYDPTHPNYFNEPDLRVEMERVFDLCHGCRLCFNLCPSFPTLFSAIDARDGDVGAMTVDEQDQVVDECYQCKLCYLKCRYVPPHEWELDFPRLMMPTMRSALEQRPGEGATSPTSSSPDRLLGKVSTKAAPVVNRCSIRHVCAWHP